MTEQPKTRRTRRIIDAFAKGDTEAFGSTPSDDVVVLRFRGHGPLAGRYEGNEGVFRFLETFAQVTGDTARFDGLDVMASNERSALLARVTAERDGKRLGTDWTEIRRFDADGLADEIRLQPEDTAALDGFFS